MNQEVLRERILKEALVKSEVLRWEKHEGKPVEHSHQPIVEIGIDDLMQLISEHTAVVERESRIDEIELAEKQNKPAGGLHRPSYYAIDPDYAEKRLEALNSKGKD